MGPVGDVASTAAGAVAVPELLWLYCLAGVLGFLGVAYLLALLVSRWNVGSIVRNAGLGPLQPAYMEVAACRNMTLAFAPSAIAAFGAASYLFMADHGAFWHPLPCLGVGIVLLCCTTWLGREWRHRGKRLSED